jgi:hypothetical protein
MSCEDPQPTPDVGENAQPAPKPAASCPVAGFYRGARLERLLRDAHGAQFHPLPAKRQHRFAGRVALGLDPIAGVA